MTWRRFFGQCTAVARPTNAMNVVRGRASSATAASRPDAYRRRPRRRAYTNTRLPSRFTFGAHHRRESLKRRQRVFTAPKYRNVLTLQLPTLEERRRKIEMWAKVETARLSQVEEAERTVSSLVDMTVEEEMEAEMIMNKLRFMTYDLDALSLPKPAHKQMLMPIVPARISAANTPHNISLMLGPGDATPVAA